jgi:hypothetical protein
MKAENWFQLRIVGVTTIEARLQPGFILEATSSNRGPRLSATHVDRLRDNLVFSAQPLSDLRHSEPVPRNWLFTISPVG